MLAKPIPIETLVELGNGCRQFLFNTGVELRITMGKGSIGLTAEDIALILRKQTVIENAIKNNSRLVLPLTKTRELQTHLWGLQLQNNANGVHSNEYVIGLVVYTAKDNMIPIVFNKHEWVQFMAYFVHKPSRLECITNMLLHLNLKIMFHLVLINNCAGCNKNTWKFNQHTCFCMEDDKNQKLFSTYMDEASKGIQKGALLDQIIQVHKQSEANTNPQVEFSTWQYLDCLEYFIKKFNDTHAEFEMTDDAAFNKRVCKIIKDLP